MAEEERVDAGGGRVPDGWRGLVTELGHDLSGLVPRARHEAERSAATVEHHRPAAKKPATKKKPAGDDGKKS